MVFSRFEGVLFFFVAERYLEGAVAVGFGCFYLCYNAGTGFDDRAGRLAAGRIEDGGHPDFFTNDSFHVAYGCFPQGCSRHSSYQGVADLCLTKGQSWFITDLFPKRTVYVLGKYR
jgi:hypothetical protein